MELPRQGDDSGGDNSGTNATKASGSKRSIDDVEDNEADNSGSKKVCAKGEEAGSGDARAVILSLHESLENSKEELASCQNELESTKNELETAKNEIESAKTEIKKWTSAFMKESFMPNGESPEPSFVIDYIQSLKSSEKSLNEQFEIAQMKLAIHDLRAQLKPKPATATVQATERITTDVDSEAASENGSTSASPFNPQLAAIYSENEEMKIRLAKAEASMEMIMRCQELVLSAHTARVGGATAVAGSAPSAVQVELLQPTPGGPE